MKLLKLLSIKKNIYVIVILAIIPALAIILYSGLEQRQRSIENAQNKVLLLAQTMAGAQQEFTRSVRQMLTTLSLLPEIQCLDRQICKKIFGSVLEKNPNYLNFALTDINGEVLASGKPLTVTNFSDRKHVREVLGTKEFSIGEYIISRIGPATPAFAFAYPVLDKNKQLKAVLTTAVKLGTFSDFHDISNLPDKSFVAVTDHKGIRLFYYPPKEDTNPVGKQIKKQSWEKASNAKGSGIFIGRGSDSVKRIFAFEQVRFKSKDTPYLYVWAAIPEAYVLGPANTALTRNLLLLISAAILSLFISWLVGKKTLLSPIQSLVNLTRRFAEGDLEARSEHNIMPNELGTLTKAFHNMADALEINQKTLRNSEEKYRRLIQNALVGIYQVTEEGRFLTVNQKMAEIFEYESRDVFLTEVNNISNLYARPEERESILQEINNKGFVGGKEVEFKTKDGKSIWLELYTTVFVDDKNTIYEGLMHDITDRKKLESQLQQAQKMEAIGTLAGGIAHDFNNILSAVVGYTELSLFEAEKESTLYHNLREVYQASERAKNLVKQILTFSRQAEQERKPVQVKLICKEAIKFLRASLPTSIKISQEIKSDALVMAEPTQIHQVLMNLCTNAGHAMGDKGGVLVIKLRDVKLEEDLEFKDSGLKPGPYIELTVRDTGHGIPERIIERIFDPFFTTKEKGEGTGMGLAVVHGIVGSYEGKITVSSEPGKGSTFRVYLPTVERNQSPPTLTEDSIITGTERILFVDDETALVNIGKQVLESLGYEVTTRTSAIEALELFKDRPDSFDLIITDMTMPNMTGDKLAVELIRIKPEIPVILCTGYSARINKEQALAMGIKAFVSKPVLRKEIAETIRSVLSKKL